MHFGAADVVLFGMVSARTTQGVGNGRNPKSAFTIVCNRIEDTDDQHGQCP